MATNSEPLDAQILAMGTGLPKGGSDLQEGLQSQRVSAQISQDDLVPTNCKHRAAREEGSMGGSFKRAGELGASFARGFGSMLKVPGGGSAAGSDGSGLGFMHGSRLGGGDGLSGLRLQGRSKSANIGSLLDMMDKEEETAGSIGKSKGGPSIRKGFYAMSPKGPSVNAGAQVGLPGSPGLSPSGLEKKGFYAMGKGTGNSPAEKKILLPPGGFKAKEETPQFEDEEWVGNRTLGRSKTLQEQEESLAASMAALPRPTLSPESSTDRTASVGSPSPRGPLDTPITTLADPPPSAHSPRLGTHNPSPRGPMPGRGASTAQKKEIKRETGPVFPKPFMGGLFWNAKGGKVADNLAKGETAPPALLEGSDRFSLLLLEEGEYYFKDYFCHYNPQAGAEQSSAGFPVLGTTGVEAAPLRRVVGTVKVCSESLFFVPRSVHEPVFRIEYRNTESIERGTRPGGSAVESESAEAEEFFIVKASERTDVRIGNRHVPYKAYKGDFSFHFALVYTSLNAVLPRVQKLLDIAKGPFEEKAKRLSALVKRHEEELHFNAGWFERTEETLLLEFVGSRITPLVSQPGRIVLTAWNVYFQPFNVVSSAPVQRYKLENVTSIMRRSSVLEEIGVELSFSAWNSVYFMFRTPEDCTRFYEELLKQPGLSLEKMKSLEQWQKEWVRGKVSNFDYLMFLNREANRSFNDLSQYPVFPWVIADYTSKKLDLERPGTFRDLSKPIGALEPERLASFKERYRELAESYEDWCEEFAPDPPPPNVPGTPSPPYLYGCHYSTPGYVVFFKLRDHPQLMLRLQNGRYDMPDRLMSSVPELWKSAITKSTDLKELIPEFFSLNPSFLVNSEGLDFGSKQSGEKVGDVELPPWAEDPMDFCKKMREALESPYVSSKLHKWINLIFGCKQQGAAAIEADNVFHPLTYDDIGAEVLASIEDEATRAAVRVQMREFGRTPKQLFRTLHPKQRRSEVRKLLDLLRTCSRHLRSPFLFLATRVNATLGISEAGRAAKPPRFPWHRNPRSSTYRSVLGGALSPLAELGRQDRSVYRAIARVVSKDRAMQTFALEWLEQNALFRGSDMLEVTKPRHLAPLLPLANSRKPEKRVVAIRAAAALAKPWPNRQLLLEAGFLDHIQQFLCSGPYREGTRAAVTALSRLTTEDEAVEKCGPDTVDALLALLSPAGAGLEEESFAEAQAHACEALGNLAVSAEHRDYMISCRGIPRLLPLAQAGEAHTAELREMALRAVAALAVDPPAQMQVVRQGGLGLALQMCEEETGLVQEAAVWLVAALAANGSLRRQIAAEGGLQLLCGASCAKEGEIQEAAALGLSWLCQEASIIVSLVTEGGLWSLLAMAQSTHLEVQRLAAGVFWHWAVHYENKHQIVDMGGLQALLALSHLGEKNPQATSLAEEALLKLADDEEMRVRLSGDDSFTRRTRSIVREVLATPSSSPRMSVFSSTVSSPTSSSLSKSTSLDLPRQGVRSPLGERSISMRDEFGLQQGWQGGDGSSPLEGPPGPTGREESEATEALEPRGDGAGKGREAVEAEEERGGRDGQQDGAGGRIRLEEGVGVSVAAQGGSDAQSAREKGPSTAVGERGTTDSEYRPS